MIHLTSHKANKKFKNKMDGFTSINVSVKLNPFCQAMQKKDDTICKHCYAKSVYPNMEARYTENLNWFLSDDFRPEPIDRKIIRLHSFGELFNEKHFINIVKLINYNPDTQFALWTKRKDIVTKVLDKMGKPENLILILSSPKLNQVSGSGIVPMYFDKVFTVFEAGQKVEINCQKSCRTCMKCYNKNDKTVFINEELKLPQNNFKKKEK